MTTVIITGGSATVPSGGTLIVDGPIGSDDVINFFHDTFRNPGLPSTLVINQPASFQGRIGGFSSIHTIRFANSIDSITVDPEPGLPPLNGVVPALIRLFTAGAEVNTIRLDPTVGEGWFFDDTFTVASDGSGYLLLTTDHVMCLAAGTPIQTARGDVKVEDLRVGDAIPTVVGRRWRPVRWIGKRMVRVNRHPRPWDVAPVRVQTGAISPGIPMQDVRLSPDHAILMNGKLIPVRYLVNGATIAMEAAEQVTYFHVELGNEAGEAQHDVIRAAGLAVESFLDTTGRSMLADRGYSLQARPEFARSIWASKGCAPLVLDGPHLIAARWQTLQQAERLGFRTSTDPCLHVLAAGRTLLPDAHGDVFRFRLPLGAGRVWLVSRTFVPAQTQPASDDCRRLGVGVGSLRLDGRLVLVSELPEGDGWHDCEPDCRWTTGYTEIESGRSRSLEVLVARTGRYWVEAAHQLRHVA